MTGSENLGRVALVQIQEVARQSFSHRRGSPEACQYADALARSYLEDGRGDPWQRRPIAVLCEWLRHPDADAALRPGPS